MTREGALYVMLLLWVFYLGACIGSFTNVVLIRLKSGENFINDRSRCPECGYQIALYDNIPLVSYLLLRARCRNCKTHIAARYFIAELSTGMLFAAIALLL